MNGKLIVLEGVEGSGKTTQLNHLETWLSTHPLFQELRMKGIIPRLVRTREPGGTPLGSALRDLLLDPAADIRVGAKAELLLYAADRAQHIEEVILPALQEGSWVLCDRFIDSTVAYQGYGRGLSLSLIETLNRIAAQSISGDLTLWLKVPAAEGLKRSHSRGQLDRMEQVHLDFHQRVQQGFETLAEQHPRRIIPIDATQPPPQVTAQIQAVMEHHLKQWYGKYLPTS